MEGEQPGVSAAPPVATPAAVDTTPQAAPEAPQSVGDDVKAPESQEQQIPYDRFKEVNDKAKSAEERATKAERELAESKAKPPEPSEEEDVQIDPEAKKTLDAYLRSQGFVTKKELEAEKLRIQVDNDVKELKGEFSDFDQTKVLEYAGENGLQVTNKAGLKSAYNLMKNSDPNAAKQTEDEIRNRVIAELKESGQLVGAGAEKPGPGGPKVTPAEEPSGLKARIAAAAAKHRS